MRRLIASAVLLPFVLVALTGCGIDRLIGLRGVACASWVAYESDEQRFDDADAVLVVTDIEPDGTVDIMGYDASAYRVTVVEVDKGDLIVGYTLRVGSTADNCASSPYGDGDPMLDAATLRLYLTDDEGQWRTITPFDGVQTVD